MDLKTLVKCSECGNLTCDQLIFGECFMCDECYPVAVKNFVERLEEIQVEDTLSLQ